LYGMDLTSMDARRPYRHSVNLAILSITTCGSSSTTADLFAHQRAGHRLTSEHTASWFTYASDLRNGKSGKRSSDDS
jgi:hypothetical protein